MNSWTWMDPTLCSLSGVTVDVPVCGNSSVYPPEYEVVLDTEQSMRALVVRRKQRLGNRQRHELRSVEFDRLALVAKRGCTTRKHVLEPIRVQPVRQRDHESVLGRHRADRCLVRPAA